MAAPNIVYVMFDQAKASAMSFQGNADISLPFCESLAERGWIFEQAYAAAPICTPSRASVHTGMFPQVHGVTCHQNRAPFNPPQLAELLQTGGYYTAAAGSYEPERNLDRGWHEQSPMHERGPLYDSWMAHIRSGRNDVAWSAGAIEVDAKDGNSALLTDRALRMLDQAEASGRPFFLHLCYDDPHPLYFVPRPYDTMFDPDSLTLPETGDIEELPGWHKAARAEVGTDRAADADFRKVLAVNYGMIRYIDDEMTRLFAALEAKGLLGRRSALGSADQPLRQPRSLRPRHRRRLRPSRIQRLSRRGAEIRRRDRDTGGLTRSRQGLDEPAGDVFDAGDGRADGDRPGAPGQRCRGLFGCSDAALRHHPQAARGEAFDQIVVGGLGLRTAGIS